MRGPGISMVAITLARPWGRFSKALSKELFPTFDLNAHTQCPCTREQVTDKNTRYLPAKAISSLLVPRSWEISARVCGCIFLSVSQLMCVERCMTYVPCALIFNVALNLSAASWWRRAYCAFIYIWIYNIYYTYAMNSSWCHLDVFSSIAFELSLFRWTNFQLPNSLQNLL